MEGQNKVLELVVFRTKAGVSRDEFLKRNEPVSTWISEQPGFISRDLSYDSEGDRWVDVLWWQTMGEALTASERAVHSDTCSPFFALIDMEDMLMLHGETAIPRVERAAASSGVR